MSPEYTNSDQAQEHFRQVKALLDIEGGGVSEYRRPDYSKFKRD